MPGQYIAADPKGRAAMIGWLEFACAGQHGAVTHLNCSIPCLRGVTLASASLEGKGGAQMVICTQYYYMGTC